MLIDVRVAGVMMPSSGTTPVLLLQDVLAPSRWLVIWVGHDEAGLSVVTESGPCEDSLSALPLAEQDQELTRFRTFLHDVDANDFRDSTA